MRKKETNRTCPECGGDVVLKRNNNAKSSNTYQCKECEWSERTMPTG